ncbi:MAG: hypothetical protein KTR25_19160 [Myxococcales bacterium]|nr:hypothetical protein [Myxococcales bacterium]
MRDLETTIYENPHNLDAWTSYGHCLTSAGDPRGDLVTSELAKVKLPQEAEALDRQSQATIRRYVLEWLGPEMAQALLITGEYDWLVQLTWRFGFVWSARVRRASADLEPVPSVERLLKTLKRSSASRFLYSLSIGLPDWGEHADFREIVATLDKMGEWPSVRRLFIGDYERPDEMEISWTTIGNIGKIYSVFPNLEWLKVQGGGIQLGKLHHAKLQTLVIQTAGLAARAVSSLGRANLPSLSNMEIWFGDEHFGAEATPDMLGPLLLGDGLPRLRRLGLMNAEIIDDCIDIIAGSRLLSQLEVLDLSMGTLTSRGVDRLIYHAARFQHLTSLNVSDNFLSTEAVEALVRTLGTSVQSCQQKGDENESVFYVSVSE